MRNNMRSAGITEIHTRPHALLPLLLKTVCTIIKHCGCWNTSYLLPKFVRVAVGVALDLSLKQRCTFYTGMRNLAALTQRDRTADERLHLQFTAQYICAPGGTINPCCFAACTSSDRLPAGLLRPDARRTSRYIPRLLNCLRINASVHVFAMSKHETFDVKGEADCTTAAMPIAVFVGSGVSPAALL